MTDGGESEQLPFGEDLDELERLSAEQGLHALDVPEKLIEDELRRKSKARRVVETVGSLAVTIVMFAFIIPWLTKADYADAWQLIRSLTAAQVAVLFGAWFLSLFTVWTFLTHSLPGLKVSQAGVMNMSGSAVANVIPFGGAVGIGATYAQGLSWGFDAPSITLSVLVSGVWNVFSKLAFPIIALALLAATGESAPGLNVAAYTSVAIVGAAVIGFAAVIRNEGAAVWVGDRGQTVVNGLRRIARRPPSHGVTDAVLDFRHRSVALVRKEGGPLTVWIVLYKVTSFFLQYMCVRALGIGANEVTWVEVLAAYTLGELLTASPITPSGVGLVEAGSAGLLISFGAPPDAAVASVLLFRAFTFLFEIPAGGVAWLIWATNRRWRRPPVVEAS